MDAVLASEYWDSEAAVFDAAPDHGLQDPAVRDAWVDRFWWHVVVDPSVDRGATVREALVVGIDRAADRAPLLTTLVGRSIEAPTHQGLTVVLFSCRPRPPYGRG